ncbi:MAG: NAD(+)/NADH kinase [Acidimicrobiales bacterium]
MTLIAFTVHPDRPRAVELAQRAGHWLADRGHESTVSAISQDGTTDPIGKVDLVVSLGGDGTLLRSVELASSTDTPVLGVNLGRLGFLTQVEPSELESALEAFLGGTATIDERMTLSVATSGPDGAVIRSAVALNEATVEKTVPGHTVRIATSVNDRAFVTYAADGLVVSTPTGSTAYNLSARGPVLSPLLRALVVTPVAPHMLFDRPLVLAANERLELEVLEPRDAVLVVDGTTIATLRPGSTIRCEAGTRAARLVTLGTRSFHDIVRAKFHLADR